VDASRRMPVRELDAPLKPYAFETRIFCSAFSATSSAPTREESLTIVQAQPYAQSACEARPIRVQI
jgi:hypothetical protein